MKFRAKALPTFIMHMYKETPDTKIKRKLMKNYRAGGVEFEQEVKDRMPANMSKEWGPSINKHGKSSKWVYVGDYWWARKVSGKYEFGKLHAMENDMKSVERRYVGLWHEDRHGFEKDEVIVYSLLGRKGYVVGWNEHELKVEWEDLETYQRAPPAKAVKFTHLSFEYEEDYRKFRKLYGK